MNALKLIADLIRGNQKSTGSDYTAKVTKIEGKTAYVQLTGAEIIDTPVALTINAKEGDMVRVRVNNGKAWITGNDDSPPTDDRTATQAQATALYASSEAAAATNAAGAAVLSAANARQSANAAAAAASEAQTSAQTANQAANNALAGLSTLEHVIDTVNWFAEHKKASTDTTVNVNKTYYIYDAITGTLSAVTPVGTENPSQEGWYELDEAISNYVITHVATTADGLSIVGLGNGWRVLISSGQGSYDPGIYLINSNGEVVSEFGEDVRVGKNNSAHITIKNTEFHSVNKDGATNFKISTSENRRSVYHYFPINKSWQFGSSGATTPYTYTLSVNELLGELQLEAGNIIEIDLEATGNGTFDYHNTGIGLIYGEATSHTTTLLDSINVAYSYDGEDAISFSITANAVSETSRTLNIRRLLATHWTYVPSFMFGSGVCDDPFACTIGEGLLSSGSRQVVIGRYNKENSYHAFEIGNGLHDGERSNAFSVDWDGNLAAAGYLYFKGGKAFDMEDPFAQMKVAQQTSANRPLILQFDLTSGYYDVQQVIFTNTGIEYHGRNRSTQAWERIW